MQQDAALNDLYLATEGWRWRRRDGWGYRPDSSAGYHKTRQSDIKGSEARACGSGRRSRSTADAPKAIPTAAAAVKSAELEVDDIDEETLEGDESLPEDTSDLVGGDDDDVSDVIENVETNRD